MGTVIDRIGELLSLLQSPDFYEREEAVRELGTYNEDEAVAGLVMAMEDPDLGIRELAANLLTQMRGDIASRLLIRFLGHGDIGTRNLAAEILVKIGSDAVGPLIEDLDNDDYDIRKFIVDVLGLIKDPRAIEPLCEKLWDENENVACSAAEALGEIGSNKAVKALIVAIERVEDARVQAVEALGKIGDPSTLETLYGMLDTDDPMTLYAALEAIGQIGQKASVPKLLPFLDSKDDCIGETALMAIVNISLANDGALDHDLPLDKYSDFLFNGIRNRNRKLTEFTLGRLNHWNGSDVIGSLLDVVDSVDEENHKRISEILEQAGALATKLILQKLPAASTAAKLIFLETLQQSVDEEMARKLLPFAVDQEPEVRQKTAQVLGVSGWSGAVGALKELAADAVGHVRATAYASLGWLVAENEIGFLFKGLDDKYSDVRDAALGALIVVGSPRVVEMFSADLNCDNIERQRLAVSGLGKIGDPEVVEPLLNAINHPDASVRKLAIIALGRIQQVENVQPLILSLSDESTAVRKAAASALIAIRGEQAVADIRFLLDDEDVWVRYHAINTIGGLGSERYAEYILPYLDDEQDVIKIAATKALAQMGSTEAIPRLNQLRQDKNKDLAEAVVMAVSDLEEIQ